MFFLNKLSVGINVCVHVHCVCTIRLDELLARRPIRPQRFSSQMHISTGRAQHLRSPHSNSMSSKSLCPITHCKPHCSKPYVVLIAAETAQIPTEASKEDVVAPEQPEEVKKEEKTDDKQPVENDMKKLNIGEAAQEANEKKPEVQEEGFVPIFFRQCFLHWLQSLFIKLSISKLRIYTTPEHCIKQS